jgi:hypothetical protein
VVFNFQPLAATGGTDLLNSKNTTAAIPFLMNEAAAADAEANTVPEWLQSGRLQVQFINQFLNRGC